VKPGDITRVTLTSTTAADPAATAWSQTRAQVQIADNLAAVIELYQKFAEQYPKVFQAEEALALVTSYRAMLARDPVKFQGKWMPRAQMVEIGKRQREAVRPALDLYEAGQVKTALDAIVPVAGDELNGDALMLAGLCSYRQKNYLPARGYFTKLLALDATNVAGENNLAAVCMAQKQVPEAMVHFTRALQIVSSQRLLVDNVAEVLHAYGNGDKNNPAYKGLMAVYAPAEANMEAEMGKRGQLRLGSTWVTREQKDHLDKQQAELQAMMASLDAQYTTFQARLSAVQKNIATAGERMDNFTQIINTSLIQMNQGQGTQTQPALDYSDRLDAARRDHELTQAYRAELQTYYNTLVSGTGSFFAQAEKLKTFANNGGPMGQFAGVPRLMDWGEVDNPPAPMAVIEVKLPEVHVPELVTDPPSPPRAPELLPIPQPTPTNPPGLHPIK